MLYEDDNRIDLIYARVSTNKQKTRGDLNEEDFSFNSYEYISYKTQREKADSSTACHNC